MGNNTKTIKIGCGSFCIPLAILFIILKVENVIEWSWVWVLSPLWIPWAVFALAAIFTLGFMLLVVILKAVTGR
ncbi:hypothetical protein EVJ32_05000 [Exiguobacterium sp. SH5S4]|nr:hypothetical protein EVJ32_05000 [Exiguobacterium sp. SH5S4]